MFVRGPSPRDVIRFHIDLRVSARWSKERRVRVRVRVRCSLMSLQFHVAVKQLSALEMSASDG